MIVICVTLFQVFLCVFSLFSLHQNPVWILVVFQFWFVCSMMFRIVVLIALPKQYQLLMVCCTQKTKRESFWNFVWSFFWRSNLFCFRKSSGKFLFERWRFAQQVLVLLSGNFSESCILKHQNPVFVDQEFFKSMKFSLKNFKIFFWFSALIPPRFC